MNHNTYFFATALYCSIYFVTRFVIQCIVRAKHLRNDTKFTVSERDDILWTNVSGFLAVTGWVLLFAFSH